MMKKLLFIIFLCISTFGSSQEKSIDRLSAAPNPFTNSTKITYKSIDDSPIIFTVKNVLGKTIYKKIVKTATGHNSFLFSKGNLNTGIYIYSIQNKIKIISKRFVIK